MLHELLRIFRSGNPLKEMADEFGQMLQLTCEMTVTAGDIYFGKTLSAEDRTKIYSQDVRVNKLERKIRKRVVAHLSVSRNTADLPYCLLLMSLVKDVERLGDYAKNLSEVIDIHSGELPDDDIVAELKEIRAGVEEAFRASARVFPDSDRERALTLIRHGKDLAQRSDGLLLRIAKSSYPADTTTALVLGARYYKRIGGHVLNLLSAVVMPLHKVDYYDEDEIPASEVK
ncbi:MAG TPA: PhoU domain-containing protein [Pseudomonadales bacterium]